MMCHPASSLLICMAFIASLTFAAVNSNETEEPKSVVTDARFSNGTTHIIGKRFVRRTRGQRRAEACDMLIAVDEPLYVTYQKDLRNLTKMAQLYVKQLNEIYHRFVKCVLSF